MPPLMPMLWFPMFGDFYQWLTSSYSLAVAEEPNRWFLPLSRLVFDSTSDSERQVGVSPPIFVVKVLAGSAAVAWLINLGLSCNPHASPHTPGIPPRPIPANRLSTGHEALDLIDHSRGAMAYRLPVRMDILIILMTLNPIHFQSRIQTSIPHRLARLPSQSVTPVAKELPEVQLNVNETRPIIHPASSTALLLASDSQPTDISPLPLDPSPSLDS